MKPILDGTPPDPAAVTLAARVLNRARREQWAAAAALLDRLGDMGARGQLTLVYGMADAIAEAHEIVHGPPPDGVVITPTWRVAETGETGSDADRLEPPARWASRFVVARAAGDRDMCLALLDSLADDDQWSAAVSALVETAALTVNSLLGEP